MKNYNKKPKAKAKDNRKKQGNFCIKKKQNYIKGRKRGKIKKD